MLGITADEIRLLAMAADEHRRKQQCCRYHRRSAATEALPTASICATEHIEIYFVGQTIRGGLST